MAHQKNNVHFQNLEEPAMNNPRQLVDPTHTINQLVEEIPDALPVLHQFGLDACCGGTLPLQIAANQHHVDLQIVIDAILKAYKEHYGI